MERIMYVLGYVCLVALFVAIYMSGIIIYRGLVNDSASLYTIGVVTLIVNITSLRRVQKNWKGRGE